jgi:hypothetical protein
LVLNYGCAGAHQRDIMPGDVIIGTCVVHHSAVQFLASGEERYVGFGYEVDSERREVSELACDAALVQSARRRPDPATARAASRRFVINERVCC